MLQSFQVITDFDGRVFQRFFPILSEQMGEYAKVTFWDFVKVCFSFCYGALSIYDDTIEHNCIKSVRILKELHDFDFEIKIALKLTYKNEPKCIKEKLWTI